MIYWRWLITLFYSIVLISCQGQRPSINSSNQLSTASNYPAVFNVTTGENGFKKIGDNIDVDLFFPYPITVNGTPFIIAQIGDQTKTFNYLSGSGTNSLKFRYIVENGDEDKDGIEFDSIIYPNGGSLKYPMNGVGVLIDTPLELNFGYHDIKVDGILPTILEFADYISDPSYGPSGALQFKNYQTNEELLFRLKFSEPVHISPLASFDLFLNSTATVLYNSGTGTDTAYFKRKILSTDSAPAGFYTAGNLNLNSSITITDKAGNNLINTFNPIYYNMPDNFVYINVARPVINSITIASGTYTLGQELTFIVKFSEPVSVTGNPSILINLQSSPVSASYVSGSGTVDLVFKHKVLQDERALSGINLDSEINSSSGSIKNLTGNQYADLTIPSGQRIKSSVLINSIVGPYVTFTELPPNKTYAVGDTLQFKLTFNKIVNITGGSPRLKINAGGTTIYAPVAPTSGTGTNTLTFETSVTSGLYALAGITIDPYIELNGSQIKDAYLKDASLWFNPPSTSGIKIDTLLPLISEQLSTSAGTYTPGQTINFFLTFNRPVTVTGIPQIKLTIGSTDVYANYVSTSGNNLKFSYQVLSGQEDTDGITIDPIVNLNGGSIKDINNVSPSSLTFTVPIISINVDGLAPKISSVSNPPAGNYVEGNVLSYTVVFNQVVYVSGSPRLKLNINTNYGYATYDSGHGTNTLIFKYTVAPTLITSGNTVTAMSPLELNSGSIRDASNNYMTGSDLIFTPIITNGIFIDSIHPYINTVIASTNALPYKIGGDINFTVNFTEAVSITGSPKINLMVGNVPKTAIYSGSGASSTSHTFKYTVASGDLDLDGIYSYLPIEFNSGTIKDSFGNSVITNYLANSHPGTKVDGIIPSIQFLYYPEEKTYGKDDELLFKVSWSENVIVTGIPTLSLTVGTTTVSATYVSTTNNISTFKYKVLGTHQDLNGIDVTSPILLSGGTIKDSAGNDALLTFVDNNLPNVIVDGVTPIILAITLPTKTGTNAPYYNLGEVLTFKVSFSDIMAIDTTNGTPRLKLNISGEIEYAYYDSSADSPSDEFIPFSYTVQNNDQALPSNPISISALELQGGVIEDDAGNPASLTLPVMILASRANWLVDAKPPTLSTVTSGSVAYYPGNNIDFTFTFSENMKVTGTPYISIVIDGTTRTANYVSTAGSVLTFRYTIPAANAELDLDGITHLGEIKLPVGATLTDVGSNSPPASLNYTFTEKDFVYYTGLSARWRLDTGEYLSNVLNKITYLQDISGNGKHISMPSNGPNLVAGAFGAKSGMGFTTSNYVTLPAFLGISHYIVVATGTTLNSPIFSQNYFQLDMQFNNNQLSFWNNTKLMINNTTTGTYSNYHTITNLGPYVLAATPQSSISRSWILGLGYLSWGGLTGFGGKVAEVLIFTGSSLTDAQILKINSQLKTWYGF